MKLYAESRNSNYEQSIGCDFFGEQGELSTASPLRFERLSSSPAPRLAAIRSAFRQLCSGISYPSAVRARHLWALRLHLLPNAPIDFFLQLQLLGSFSVQEAFYHITYYVSALALFFATDIATQIYTLIKTLPRDHAVGISEFSCPQFVQKFKEL